MPIISRYRKKERIRIENFETFLSPQDTTKDQERCDCKLQENSLYYVVLRKRHRHHDGKSEFKAKTMNLQRCNEGKRDGDIYSLCAALNSITVFAEVLC